MTLVIATLAETATAASLALVDDRFTARLIAPATSSGFSIRPSTTEFNGKGSTEYDSTPHLPFLGCSSSTFTTDELIYIPKRGGVVQTSITPIPI